MAHAIPILKHFRLFLTALTLLCALTLNHKEIPAFAPATGKAPVTAVEKTAFPEQDRQVLKQKISFEAVTSFVVLDLVQPLAFLRVLFAFPLDVPFAFYRTVFSDHHFFSVLFADTIQPNAP